MATRSIVRIKLDYIETSSAIGQAPMYIHLYHHWDGGPNGVGRDLERFLRNRNDGDSPDGKPTWNGERIADELTQGNYDYRISDGNEGDAEYGYIIDCGRRILTCYDLDYGRRSFGNAKEVDL